MGRPRTPTNILDARGAFDKNPQRKRTDPATSGPIGDAPAHLNEMEAAIWAEVLEIAPQGVLTCADRFAVEEMCRLVAEVRVGGNEMTSANRSLLRTYLGQFGMTPADRAKINVPPPAPVSKYDGF